MTETDSIVIFGASNAGKNAYHRLKERHEIVGFYDNDPTKIGGTLFGIPILAPIVPLANNARKVFIAGSYADLMYTQLTRDLGLDPSLIECNGQDGKSFGWLLENKRLRMDPKSDIWAKSRRDFHVERYQFARERVAGRKVLDAACGTGYGSHILAETALSVDGVEMDAFAIDYAKEHYGSERIQFHNSFAEFLPFEDNSFDAIVSFETIEHVYAPKALLCEFTRVLRPDGILMLSAPNRWGLTPNHFTDFDYPLLKTLIDSHFKTCEFFHNDSGSRKGGSPKGTGPLDESKEHLSECIIAVAESPIKITCETRSHIENILNEIYSNVSVRHKEYVTTCIKRNKINETEIQQAAKNAVNTKES